METTQITHLEFKDLFVVLQSRLSKDALLQSAAVTLKMLKKGEIFTLQLRLRPTQPGVLTVLTGLILQTRAHH